MAKLISDNFSVEIQFVNYSNAMIEYSIRLTYEQKTIINPFVTRHDCFVVNCREDNSLLEVLQDALVMTEDDIWESGTPCWEANDYITFDIEPNFEPGLEALRDSKEISPEEEDRLQAIDNMRAMGAQFPGDIFNLNFHIQSKGLKNLMGKPIKFPGNEICISFMVKRLHLRKFHYELQKEYDIFNKRFKINEDFGHEVEKFFAGKAPIVEMTELEKKFDQEMRNIYEKAKKIGMNGDGLIALIEEHRGLKAAKIILAGPENATGANKLRMQQVGEDKGLNLTVEALVAGSNWGDLFKPEEIQKAQERFEKWKSSNV